MSTTAHPVNESPHNPARWGEAGWRVILSITALWIIMVALVKPANDFPPEL